ncbi:hypothetical protein JCM10450v2_005474 [Rhodotorula kratochvilovae]
MDFAELRRRAEAAASGARAALPSVKPVKYEPARPAYGTQDPLPSQQERRDHSTVLQWEASKHVVPPPPRRMAAGEPAAAQTNSPPPSCDAPPPPTPARKPPGLAPPAPPPRNKPPHLASPGLSRASTAVSSATSASASRPIPAPPYSHAVEHDLPTSSPLASTSSRLGKSQPHQAEPARWKKFSDYGEKDKHDLFAALDSFFNSRLEVTTTPYIVELNDDKQDPAMPASPAPYLPPLPSAAPPPVARSTRPRLAATSSSPAPFAPTPKPPELHAPSYPPAASHSSAALSLANYLLHTPFSTAWFLPPTGGPESPMPPPLIGRSDLRFTASWSQHGAAKTHVGAALFGDGSIAWWRLSWDTSSESAGRAHLDARREARYRPRPDIASWSAHELYAASEAYGPALVRFAQEAVARGEPVARGECWDLASEALEAAAGAAAGGERPFPSIGRTHGALLYYAKAGRDGTWTGGDAYVRPGDVVEWRRVRISEVGARDGAYMVLGDPDHTAIILSASPPLSSPSLPSSPPYRDATYPLASLSALTVAEQSLGQPPTVRTYDLGTLTEGEVWIYRPCGMRALCGVDEVEAVWPEERGVECWSVGELE